MAVVRCVNIDWMEVYALEDRTRYPCDADYFTSKGYHVVVREYGTRVYRQMFTIYDSKGFPFIEVRRDPASNIAESGGLFPAESCHLRLTNYACYSPNPIGDLRAFMLEHHYTLVKIFRIDIAMDFKQFDRGDDPSKFVRRYIEGVYSKVNQSNLSAHGSDTWQERKFNSLSWGAPKSMVSTKMYNKSLELQQSKDKPYIRYAWYLAGLITNPFDGTYTDADGNITKPDIWRVEFSIKASGKKWVVLQDASRHKKMDLYVPHTLDCYDSRDKLIVVFANLARCYFHFKVYQADVRKDRCRDKVLFDFKGVDCCYQLTGNVTSRPATPLYARLIRYLEVYKHNLIDNNVIKAIDVVLYALRQRQFGEFVSTSMSQQDILTLQRLISERVGSLDVQGGELARREIKTLVNDFFADCW